MKHHTLCPFPFESIAPKSWQHGKPHRVVPCCNMKTDSDDPMNVASLVLEGASLVDIFHSQGFEQLRSDLANGIKNPACDYCWKLEERTGHSPRLTALEATESIDTANPKLRKIDSMLDENCNLRCRMCSPTVSNSLRIDYNRIVELELPLPQYYNTKQDESQQDKNGTQTFFGIGEQYQQELLELCEQIEEVKFTGGEPTTSPIFWNFCEQLETAGNIGNVKLHITTNGTKFNQKFIDTVKKFSSVHITLSVDATRSTYEYMRFPFSWRKLEDNIDKLCEELDPAKTEIHMCSVLTIYNILNIRNLVDWVHQHNWFTENPITWKCIPDPHPYDSVLDVKWASVELLESAHQSMLAALDDCTALTEPAIRKTIAYLENCIQANIDPAVLKEKRALLKQDTLTLDTVRNQDYTEILNESVADFISCI